LTLIVVATLVVEACGAAAQQTDWQVTSDLAPGLVVLCTGERLIGAGECLAWGERIARSIPGDSAAARVEILTRPPGERCLFTAYDVAGRIALSATGPCEGRSSAGPPPPGTPSAGG
jgi:hypothetical protein